MISENRRRPSSALNGFLSASPAEVVHVDSAALLEILQSLGEFAEPVRDFALIQLLGESDVPLELRIGRWHLDVTRGMIQSAISTAILLPVCHATGTNDIPLVVLAAVLPYLVTIEEVEVRASDLHVLAIAREDFFLPNEIERVYGNLPDDIRHELTLLEFRDLAQRLTTAGRLQKNSIGRFQMTAVAFRETRAVIS